MRTHEKKEGVCLDVTDDLTVTVIPDSDHEFLMLTKEVANGYGISDQTIRKVKERNLDEMMEGKHFLSSVTIRHGASPGASKATLWTKRGIVRLGFFIKSERARLFRDWAEDLVIYNNQPQPPQLPDGQNHVLIGLVADAAMVIGNHNRLAAHIGVSAATLTHLRTHPHLVSPAMQERLQTACQSIIEHGHAPGLDPELVDLMMRIPDEGIRLPLWQKIRKGGAVC